MTEIIALVMVIMVMVVDTIVFRGLRRRLDACVKGLYDRLDLLTDRVSLIEGKTCDLDEDRYEFNNLKILVAKMQRDGNLMAEHLGIEYYTKPSTSTPETRCIRKKQMESEEADE